MCRRQRPSSFHGPINSKAPSLNDFLSSGMRSVGSKEYSSPNPSHERHMPCGLLKLKSCGLGGSKLMPQCVHAYAAEKIMSPGCPDVRPRRLRDDVLSSVTVSSSANASVFSLSPVLRGEGRGEGSSFDSAATIRFPSP